MRGTRTPLAALIWQRLHKYSSAFARRAWNGYVGRLQPAGAEIPSYTSRTELRLLYDLARACPPGSRALEIGSHLGASSVAIAAGLAAQGGHLYCVDTWHNETMPEGSRDTWAEFARNTASVAESITAVRKRSDELTDHDVPRGLHLVFLDGDHGYEPTRHDFDLAARLLAPDGTIAMHDFGVAQFPGVSRAAGEALAGGDWVMTALVERVACLRRARWVEPEWLANDRS